MAHRPAGGCPQSHNRRGFPPDCPNRSARLAPPSPSLGRRTAAPNRFSLRALACAGDGFMAFRWCSQMQRYSKVVGMRRSTTIALALVLAPLASASGTTLDYQGYGFTTGKSGNYAAGSVLSIPVIVNAAGPSLGLDTATEEMTGWITGLVSAGPTDGGDGVQIISFSAGRIEFYRDPLRDHDFGTLPPNATVPSTFTNGDLCLAGALTDFALFLEPETQSGAYEGNLTFDSGSCLEQLNALSAEGFTFGGVLSPAVVGGAVPDGYAFQADGFLEAQKVPNPECAIQCFGIEAARFDFPRVPKHTFRPTDGKFKLEGEFIGCAEAPPIDPEQIDIRVQMGDYVQVLPAGSLHPAHRDECDDDTDGPCWVYSNSNGRGTTTRFEMQFDTPEGEWDFAVHGRGIPRSTLIGADNLLTLDIDFGDQSASTQTTLVQKKNYLRYVRHGDTCGPGSGRVVPGIADRTPQDPPVEVALPVGAMAAPNPMRDSAAIQFRAAANTRPRLQIFDVSGRLVRALDAQPAGNGLARATWDGRDSGGTRVAAGLYIYRAEGAPRRDARKLVVTR